MLYTLSEMWCDDGTRSPLPPDWPLRPPADQVVVGDRIGPASYIVDAGAMERYAAAMGVERALYPTVPAKIESTLGHHAARRDEAGKPLGGKPKSLNARMQLELRRPCDVGDVLTFDGHITDIYERRGKRYVVAQCQTTREDGQVIERLRKTWAQALEDAAKKWDFLRTTVEERADPVRPTGRPADRTTIPNDVAAADDTSKMPAIRSNELSVGVRIAEMTIDYSWDHICEYEFVVPHALGMHNSFDKAKAAGFTQPFASGTMIVAHTIENLLPDAFGVGWTRHGSLNMVNTRPILAGSKVVLSADVVAKVPTGDDSLIVMDIRASLVDDGSLVAVGSAGALALG